MSSSIKKFNKKFELEEEEELRISLSEGEEITIKVRITYLLLR